MLLLRYQLLERGCEEGTRDGSDRRTDILRSWAMNVDRKTASKLPVSAQYVFGLRELEGNLPQSAGPQNLKPQDASWQTR